MFSIMSSQEKDRIPFTVAIVLGTLLLAFLLSVTAVVQVFDEYRMLGLAGSSGTGPWRVAEIEALRQDIGTRIIVRSIASAVLLLCTLATLWLQQRQLAIRRTLAPGQAARPRHPGEPEPGGHHDRPAGDHHQHQLGRDRPDRGRRRVHRPADRLASRRPRCRWTTCADRSPSGRGPCSDRELTLDRAGRVRRLVASALELKDMRGATIGCVIHLRDVTERMLMKEQMWRMEQFASLSTLASGLLHEIKNPMTALSIHVQLLEERLRDERRRRAGRRDDRRPEDRGPPAQRHARELPRLRQPRAASTSGRSTCRRCSRTSPG